MYCQSDYKSAKVPIFVGILGSLAFFTLIIFNKSEFKIRFMDWGLGALVVFVIVVSYLLRGRIAKKEIAVILIPLLWMGYALIGTPFALDIELHLSKLIQSMLLSIIATFVIIATFTREKIAFKAISVTTFVWVLLNFFLLVAWRYGYFTYAKHNFAGLFANRNEFSVQTVILLSMLFCLLNKRKIFKISIGVLCGVMIVATLSVKGFVFFIFIVFFPLFLKVNLYRKFLVILSAILVCILAYSTVPSIQVRIDRFSMYFTNHEELRQSESAFVRGWLVVEGAKNISKRPAFGVGVDNARLVLIPPHVLEKGGDKGMYSHNNYIEMLMNAGFIGFFLHYAPLIFIYFRVNKNNRYFVSIKTMTALYLLLGAAMVEYNNFSTIFLYSLIIFLFIHHNGSLANEKPSLCCLHS